MENNVIILAGGQGKRMKTNMPKALCNVIGEPMLAGYAWLAWRLEKCRPYPRPIAGDPCQVGAGKSIALLGAAASGG